MLNIRKAITSMCLGIISCSLSLIGFICIFFHLFFSGCISSIALVLGIISIVFAASSLHCGRAVAGLVTGIIGTSLSGLLLLTNLVIGFFL